MEDQNMSKTCSCHGGVCAGSLDCADKADCADCSDCESCTAKTSTVDSGASDAGVNDPFGPKKEI